MTFLRHFEIWREWWRGEKNLEVSLFEIPDLLAPDLLQLPLVPPSQGHVPGTSEVSPKLKFPVEPLMQYLQERHGLHQDGKVVLTV